MKLPRQKIEEIHDLLTICRIRTEAESALLYVRTEIKVAQTTLSVLLLRNAHLEQLVPPGSQFLHRLRLRIQRRPRRGLLALGEQREKDEGQAQSGAAVATCGRCFI